MAEGPYLRASKAMIPNWIELMVIDKDVKSLIKFEGI